MLFLNFMGLKGVISVYGNITFDLFNIINLNKLKIINN